MNYAIIASTKDPAGITIHNSLLEQYSFVERDQFDGNLVYESKEHHTRLYLIKDELVLADNLHTQIKEEILIFASKHRSGSDTKSFAVHSIGNWGSVKGGGKSEWLCLSSALLQLSIFKQLLKNGKNDFEKTMEATHHGPYTEKPSVFVEVGSTEKEWKDKTNGSIIAKCIMEGILAQEKTTVAIGIGGPHYCNNFNKLSERKNIAFSHIYPKYLLEQLTPALVQQAIQKTVEEVDYVVVDWKGLGKQKQHVVDVLKSLGQEYHRTDVLLKNHS